MMKTVKTAIGKIISRFFFLAVLTLMLPSFAQAYTLDIQNPYSSNMSVALIDFEDNAQKWRCHGWFTVPANTTKRISIPSATTKKNIYMYVKTSEASWSGEGIPSSVVRKVISGAFKYYDGQVCPDGANRREVFFAKYELEDGFMYWAPEE